MPTQSVRAARKLDRLWGHGTGLSDAGLARIQMDKFARGGATPSHIANEMARTVRRLPGLTDDSTVLDATACVGGDTIALARVFRNVTAVEINRGRASMLENNLRVCASEGRRLKGVPNVIVGNCTTIWKDLPAQDVVFMSPSWNGTGYKHSVASCYTLSVSGVPLHKLCRMLSNGLRSRYVAINLPRYMRLRDLLQPDDGDPPVVHCDAHMDNVRLLVLSYNPN
jgi:hypothetical protein